MDQQSKQPTEETPKVVNLFTARKQAAENSSEELHTKESKEKADLAFNEAMRKNMDNAERLRRERLKANQGVLKSYRIKN